MKTKLSKIILATACACSLGACQKTVSKLTISVENNISSIHRAEEIQITSAMENLEGTVSYTVKSNKDTEEIKYATISETGLLRCSEEAPVGAIITVEGVVNGVTSNPLSFTVQNTYATSIEIVATGEDGRTKENFTTSLDEITLTTLFTPAYATIKTVRYSIVDGEEFAVVDEEGVVSLISGIDFEDTAKNQVVEVKATVVNSDTSAEEVSATKTLVINGILPDKIELTAKLNGEDATSIKRKDEIQLSRIFSCENGEEPTIKTTSYEFEFGKEICTISKDVLKLKNIDLTPYYGTKIKFRAVLNSDDSITSNWVEIEVEELKSFIDLSCTVRTMLVEDHVVIQVNCQDGATNECTVAIAEGKGKEVAQLEPGDPKLGVNVILSIKPGQEANAVNTAITVVATSKNDPEITDSITINVIPATEIQVNTMNFVDGVTTNNHVSFAVLNKGKEIAEDQLDKSKLSFESLNAEIFTIDKNGFITAVNQGTGKVKVTYNGYVGYGKVNVMVPPTSLNIGLGLTKTFQANHRYSYSMNESLKVNITASNISGKKTTEQFKYRFDRLVNGEIVETGNSVATIDSESYITFNKTGDIKLTVTSITSLNGENTTSYEKQEYMIFDVNDGVNVRTQEQLIELNNAHNVTINLVNDIYLSGNGFGLDSENAYAGLTFFGTTKINGNGFKISGENLKFHPEALDNATRNMFTFYPEGQVLDGENSRIEENKAWSVSIKDLEVVGMMGVAGTYIGNDPAAKDLNIINKDTGKPRCVFEKAFHFGTGDYYKYAGLRVPSSCLENVIIENCNVHNFRFGIRIEHALYALIKDTYIGECYESGLIISQCFATLENPWFGQVGTFAIEMTSDGMVETNAGPVGCAGRDYNQTATLYLNGDIVRDGTSSVGNWNNGAATPGMKGFTLGDYTVPMVIGMLTQGIIEAIVEQVGGGEVLAERLKTAVSSCMYRNGGDSLGEELNLFLLIFVNPTDFGSYALGNQEGRFGEFKTNNTQENMITLVDLLIGIATGTVDPSDYQYIRIDLDVSSIAGKDIGDAIIINQAYKGLAK